VHCNKAVVLGGRQKKRGIMAESNDKAAKSAEEAYAAAAAEAKSIAPVPAEAAPAASDKPAVKESAPAEKPAEKAVTAKPAPPRKPAEAKTKSKNIPAAKKPANNKARTAANVTRKKSSPPRGAARKAPTAAPAAPEPTITELKEKIMATATTTDFTIPMTEAMSEVQARTKAAFEKSTELATELTEFSKGNVEALVESGKVLAGGMQDLGKTYVDEARSAYETMTADMKEMASVKSPTELLQLQAKLARRNFDTLFAYSSKNGEAMMKLVNEAFAPLSGRMNLAAEKISRAA
jgi:phasin family protein